MNLRLRSAALSAIAVVTAGLISATGTAPAHAAEGETCKDPIITGTIERVVTQNSIGLSTVWAEFQQEGFTEAVCPPTFQNVRYRVSFKYDGRTVSSYNTSLEAVYSATPFGLMRTGTRIVFPDLRLSWAGYKAVDLTVTSGSKSVFSNVWCRSDEETYDRHIFTEEWGGYDTLTGVPRGKTIACP